MYACAGCDMVCNDHSIIMYEELGCPVCGSNEFYPLEDDCE